MLEAETIDAPFWKAQSGLFEGEVQGLQGTNSCAIPCALGISEANLHGVLVFRLMGRANLSEQIKVAVGIVCRVANLEVYAVDGECVLDVLLNKKQKQLKN